MNWEEMTPEQRDVLVAEKVMGHETGEMPSGTLMMWNDSGLMEEIPRYTQSMDVAWLVVRMMNNSDSPTFHSYQGYADFIDALEKIVGSNLFFDLFYCDKDGDHLTPERICKAALEAVGVDVR